MNNKNHSRRWLWTLLLLFPLSAVRADIADDIGFTALQAELAGSLPDGADTAVMHIEAGAPFFPDSSHSSFTGKTLVNLGQASSSPHSGHATTVGRLFYGSPDSLLSSVTDIGVYDVSSFIFDFLKFNSTPSRAPQVSSRRVANHSWVGGHFVDGANQPAPAATSSMLRRLDWLIARDEFIHVTAPNNGSAGPRPLLTTAYNVIVAGKSNADHLATTTDIDSIYEGQRPAVHLVVPYAVTSSSAPLTASAATLLVDAARDNPSWSAGSTSNRHGETIYNAARSEVIKAVLMAGASRSTVNSTAQGDVRGYRDTVANRTDNGLDWRYGAGQLDIASSYQILAAGEGQTLQAGGGLQSPRGFAYQGSFGGAGGSDTVLEYSLPAAASPQLLAVSLVWNLAVAGPSPGSLSFDDSAQRYDLNLSLLDVTAGGNAVVASSNSASDNSENLWLTIEPGRDYRLRAEASGAAFDSDYAIAWRASDFIDSDGDGQPNHLDTDPSDGCVPEVFVAACDSDSDGDGLSDYSEGEMLDSDGDGLADYLESNIADDDGDGLPNHLESNSSDGDGDGAADQFDIWNDNRCLPDAELCEVEIPLFPAPLQIVLWGLLLAIVRLFARRGHHLSCR